MRRATLTVCICAILRVKWICAASADYDEQAVFSVIGNYRLPIDYILREFEICSPTRTIYYMFINCSEKHIFKWNAYSLVIPERRSMTLHFAPIKHG